MPAPMRLPPFASLAIVALASSMAQAQPQFVARASLGFDQHADSGTLSEWQTSERLQISARGIEPTTTDDFPAYTSLEGAIGVRMGNIELGLLAGTSSTGGRLAYSDYSGSLIVERVAQRLAFGIYGEALPFRAGPAQVGGGLAARLNRTTVEDQRDLVIGDEAVEDIGAKLTSRPLSIEPMLLGEAALVGPVHARIRLGWEVSSETELSGTSQLPPDARQLEPTVRWSGLRASIGVAIRTSR